MRRILETGEFLEIFVDVPVAECIKRDPKGLYAKALNGEIKNFTGIGGPYERPVQPEIHIDGLTESVDSASERVIAAMLDALG